MKRIYEAANAIEAHMIVHLLGQAGIEGRVEGEYLQGGDGELPAVGLVGVSVPEEHADRARSPRGRHGQVFLARDLTTGVE